MVFTWEIALLLFGLGVILAGAELFTNAVEWVGRRLGLNEGAVGSVLAAVGTAMPETLVPVVALLSGDCDHSYEIGIGAILGAPLMLSTLAFVISGLAVLGYARRGRRGRQVTASPQVMRRDLGFFLVIYALVILAGVFDLSRTAGWVFAGILVLLYMVYLHRTFRCPITGDVERDLPPLFFSRLGRRKVAGDPALPAATPTPSLSFSLLQLAVALLVIILGVQGFVRGITLVSQALGVSTFVLAVIITPIATELPEKFNSIIWISQGKDTLALGNITGAMVFQSSLIPALGILLTPWALGRLELAVAGITLASAGLAYVSVRRKGRITTGVLLTGGFFYLLFIAAAVAWH